MSSRIRIQRICQRCGQEFTAKTTVTKYCGDSCAKLAYKARKRKEKIETSKSETFRTILQPIEMLKSKPFLSISETAKILGVSRRTLYRMIERKDLPIGKIGRRTIIKRDELDKLFVIKPTQIQKPSSTGDLYMLSEIQEKFGISESTVHAVIRRNNIPKTKIGWYSYVPKDLIDQILT